MDGKQQSLNTKFGGDKKYIYTVEPYTCKQNTDMEISSSSMLVYRKPNLYYCLESVSSHGRCRAQRGHLVMNATGLSIASSLADSSISFRIAANSNMAMTLQTRAEKMSLANILSVS